MRPSWLYAAGAATGMAIVGSSFAVLDTLRDYPQAGGQALRYAIGAAILFATARGVRPPLVPAMRLALHKGSRPGKCAETAQGGSDPPWFRWPVGRQWVRLALLAASGLAAFNLLVMAAEESMDPGSVGVIVATVPVLLALACEAAFSLLAAPMLHELGPVTVSAWAATLAVPMLLATGLVLDGPGGLLRVPTAEETLGLAWLAVAVTAIAFVLWYSSVQALGVERTGLLTGVLPVSALVVAALLGTADLTPGRLAGAVLVGAGIAAGLLRTSRSFSRA
jgi:drug/metabolite transporter (DMT)-like permease